MRSTALLFLAAALLAACGGDDDRAPPPGLFESQGTIDWDPVPTLAALAAHSDAVVSGTLVDVDDGYVFGDSIDDEFGSPLIELLIDTGASEPMRLVWSYVRGHSIDEIREAFPIGAPVVVYATRFVVTPPDQGSYHHVGDASHEHWQWTNPQGVILEDPDTGEITVYDPSVTFDDAPAAGAPIEAWAITPLAFENPELAGLCESLIADFVRGESSPYSTEAQAAEQFVVDNSILDGLELVDGAILLRGEAVGSYQIVELAGGTFAVESAEWCFPSR